MAGKNLNRRDTMKRREEAGENLRENDGSSGARILEYVVITGLIVLPLWLRAQTAEDYFHGGATNYVFGQKEKAKEQVTTGLQHFPSDAKLNGLFTLLKKEEEKQQQQQKNDQNKDQQKNQDSQKQNSDQKKDGQQKQQSNEQKKQEEKKKQEQAKNKSDQKKDAQEKKQQASEKKKQDKSDQNPEQEPQQAFAAGQMTPEQAKQLLDAQKGDEMIIPIRPEIKPRDASKPLKDW